MQLTPPVTLQLRNFVPDVLRGQVRLTTVTGGQDTSMFWGSKLSNEGLRIAVAETLRACGVLATSPDGGRFDLQVKLLRQEQPWVPVTDARVQLYVEFRVLSRADGRLMYQRQMRLVEAAHLGAAPLDPNERTRLANEAAMRSALEQLVRELVEQRW